MTHPQLILASRSPRRKSLLNQIGLKFKTIPSNISEKLRKYESPEENVKRIALEKAVSVSRRIRLGTVLGADTIVVLGKKFLGKPSSALGAKRMLGLLSGKTHRVFTGFALVDAASGKQIVGVAVTKVTFRNISKSEIDAYVFSGSPMDKAGAYGIQDDFGAVFVEKVEGCFYNVVGFPLSRFYTEYQKFLRTLNHQRK
jgi:septum formation protein